MTGRLLVRPRRGQDSLHSGEVLALVRDVQQVAVLDHRVGTGDQGIAESGEEDHPSLGQGLKRGDRCRDPGHGIRDLGHDDLAARVGELLSLIHI